MNKFDGLVNEMLCIQELNPALNVESDFLRAKIYCDDHSSLSVT